MLIISRSEVEAVVDAARVLEVIEDAFKAHGRGRVLMPPRLRLELKEYGGFFSAMPAFLTGSAGLKWVSSFPGNPGKFGKPTLMAILIYNDPQSGEPVAVMDATSITRYRSAAASAVATRYMARPDSKTLGIVGCGAQAGSHVLYMDKVMDFGEIYLYDKYRDRAEAVQKLIPDKCRLVGSPREAARADVITTLTPGNSKVLFPGDIRPGCHINAVGADAVGKQELDPAILRSGRVFVDDVDQAVNNGEVSTPIRDGVYSRDAIAGTLGQIVTGKATARLSALDVTIFDSTGLAVQDVAMARYVYERARELGVGTNVDLL
jgi:alanine dehydrogenase